MDRSEFGKVTDKVLDQIYDATDNLLRKGKFDVLDKLLQGIDVFAHSPDVLIGVLTATLPAKSKLPSRKRIYEETKLLLRALREKEDEVLQGVE